jgi:hypothetical protein
LNRPGISRCRDISDESGEQLAAFIGECIEVMLTLAAGLDDATVSKQGEMVADRGLSHVAEPFA